MRYRNWTSVGLALVLAGTLVACDDNDNPAGPESNDIVAVASSNTAFSTLVTAIQAAGLVETLQGSGPFTVFAPTDAAFDALPAGTLEGLLADTDALRDVLTYHVAAGRFAATDVAARTSIATVNGANLPVVVDGASILIDGVPVATPDIGADNGVIHVINEVLIPPSMDLTEVAVDAGFGTLVTALGIADLVTTLQGPGPFTVFAPTDAAFGDVPAGDLNALLADPDALADVLLYHVVPGELFSGDVVGSQTLQTANGASITVTVGNDGSVQVDDANVTTVNVRATNGVIHIIDAVIFP